MSAGGGAGPRLHHAALVTRDAGRARAFYEELLGLTVHHHDPAAGDDGWALVVGDAAGRPGSLLAFEARPDARRGGWGVGGVHHVALGVAGTGEQLQWKRRLTDAGVAVTGPLDRGYFTSLYFADPDGQILELATRGPGYAVDEPAGALGERFIEPPAERLPEGRARDAAGATHPEPVPEVTPSMRLEGIHHVSGITDDLEAAHAFYAGPLGLRLVKRTRNQDDGRTEHWFWAAYDGRDVAPNSAYTLFGWPGSDYRARPGPGQTRHLALAARDDEDLGRWRERLSAAGADPGPLRDRGPFRGFAFRAPDGQAWEVATGTAGGI